MTTYLDPFASRAVWSNSVHRCRPIGMVFICLVMTCLVAPMMEPRSCAADEGQSTERAPDADQGDWSTYNFDVSGSRHNHAERTLSTDNAGDLVELWRFPPADEAHTVGVIHATPSVVDGFVYFGTATYPAFYKLTPDGNIQWKYEVGRQQDNPQPELKGTRLVPADGVYSSALVTDDAVYFGDVSGVMYSLDRFSGKERWKVDSRAHDFPGAHAANLFMASPILVEDLVVIGGGAFEHMAPLYPGYQCCRGRGAVVAFDAQTGEVRWKYDVGPEPQTFVPPLKIEVSGVERTYYYGPSTSSVWSTPSYDAASHTLFFGTDVHNSPRKPTDDDPRKYTRHSAAIIAIDSRTGEEKWVTQLSVDDVWNYTLPTYDQETGRYKDQSIGDTPKLYWLDIDGMMTQVVGAGCKNGGFYVLRADNGEILYQTPLYLGPPTDHPETDPRTLALPSAIGGLQTGCATDGKSVFTNGIDALQSFPTGGRVTSISLDTMSERWRHNRPRLSQVDRRDGSKPFQNVGDPVASGIAVANGVLYFTTLVSNRLVALDAANGRVLREIELGPVFAGPSVSQGRVYVGSGNTLFNPAPNEDYYPKRYTGTLYVFGLPDGVPTDRQ